MKKNKSVINITATTLLLLLSILFIFPFYWILTGAFKDQMVTVQIPPQWFPKSPTLANFYELFKNPALQWLMSSPST